jgi:hypothetical protein
VGGRSGRQPAGIEEEPAGLVEHNELHLDLLQGGERVHAEKLEIGVGRV